MHLKDDCHVVTTNAALVLVNLDGFGNTIGELLDFFDLFEIVATERMLKAI